MLKEFIHIEFAFFDFRYCNAFFIVLLEFLMKIKIKILQISLLLFWAGCSSKDDSKTSSTSESKFSQLYKSLFGNYSCKQCHIPGGQAYDIQASELNFSSKELAYSTLMNKSALSTSASFCEGISYVHPGNPQLSYLVPVLIEEYNHLDFAGKENCQPLTTHNDFNNVTAVEKKLLLEWIQEGANL